MDPSAVGCEEWSGLELNKDPVQRRVFDFCCVHRGTSGCLIFVP
jgi:hypothetical protein